MRYFFGVCELGKSASDGFESFTPIDHFSRQKNIESDRMVD